MHGGSACNSYKTHYFLSLLLCVWRLLRRRRHRPLVPKVAKHATKQQPAIKTDSLIQEISLLRRVGTGLKSISKVFPTQQQQQQRQGIKEIFTLRNSSQYCQSGWRPERGERRGRQQQQPAGAAAIEKIVWSNGTQFQNMANTTTELRHVEERREENCAGGLALVALLAAHCSSNRLVGILPSSAACVVVDDDGCGGGGGSTSAKACLAWLAT